MVQVSDRCHNHSTTVICPSVLWTLNIITVILYIIQLSLSDACGMLLKHCSCTTLRFKHWRFFNQKRVASFSYGLFNFPLFKALPCSVWLPLPRQRFSKVYEYYALFTLIIQGLNYLYSVIPKLLYFSYSQAYIFDDRIVGKKMLSDATLILRYSMFHPLADLI